MNGDVSKGRQVFYSNEFYLRIIIKIVQITEVDEVRENVAKCSRRK